MPPSHAVYEGVFGWFVVVSHVYLMNDVSSLQQRSNSYCIMAFHVLCGTYLRRNKPRCLFCHRNHSLRCPHRGISRTLRSRLSCPFSHLLPSAHIRPYLRLKRFPQVVRTVCIIFMQRITQGTNRPSITYITIT